MDEVILSPSDFVALLNQTLEYAFPSVMIEGELANFRISKNRWVYFDLKDDAATVKFFGTVYMLPGPLEDGLKVQVVASPRLHPQFGFSLTARSIQPVGEGALKKAFELLQAKLTAEGLFEPARKRPLPFPPAVIGLVTSTESAAYADFIKIMHERWGGVDIHVANVQVQGESSPGMIVRAIEYFNSLSELPEVLVITRGGGSAEDLFAFNTEQVTRAVAASRVPTLVAIGHEIDISLAELAADRRASTPSNAAQLLVPERAERLRQLEQKRAELSRLLDERLSALRQQLETARTLLNDGLEDGAREARTALAQRRQLLEAYDPRAVLRRGYSLVTDAEGNVVSRAKSLKKGAVVAITFADGRASAGVTEVEKESTGG